MQQQYSVSLTLPLSLEATSLAEAQTQADALLTGANATHAIAAAVAAGLISGRSYDRCTVACVPRLRSSNGLLLQFDCTKC